MQTFKLVEAHISLINHCNFCEDPETVRDEMPRARCTNAGKRKKIEVLENFTAVCNRWF